LTVTHWALGDFEASAQCAAQASDLLPDRSSWYYLTAKVLAARTALDAQAPHAADLIEAAVDVAQESGDAHMLGLALACQARQALLRADLEQAMVAAEEALRIWRDIAYTEGEIMALNLLSRIGSRKGDYPTATSLATTALGVAARTGHRGGLCEATESLALAAAAEGRRERALHLLLVSQRERARLGAPVPAADARGLEVALREVSDAIGEAGAMVRARARLTRLDDLVSELTP
jgi:tetratricopeptide (TPR) repeat protein